MQEIDQTLLDETSATRVWSVAEFCKRYRLDQSEQTRLRNLLGEFANQTELLMNAQRKSSFR